MKVISNYNFLDVPKFEILLIPGGMGTRKLISNKKVLSWISNQRNTKLIISICTGSLILGAAGLLKSKSNNTLVRPKASKRSRASTIVENKRYVMDEIFSSSELLQV